jgi:tetratricopeptide (TPR) repeat protein
MSPTPRWDRAKQLFDEAAHLEGDARDTFLRDACRGDEALRREVESLLAYHEADTRFLETPVAHVTPLVDSANAPLVGTVLGAWRLEAIVGRGGMGEVYRAVRADGSYDSVAAVKVVRADVATRQFIERFRLERRVLAALDHPNIARLIDGGQTATGQPYLVMEYVDGVRITDYCDAHGLGLRRRLDLFRAVCGAVRYAHQQLRVHRDIKPDNILVTPAGVPKLLDFGIARLLGKAVESPGDGDEGAATWLMTPDYASPEQVHGRHVTTTSDVYSLGVLLYELLTGRRPYRFAVATPADLRAQLGAASVPLPSAAALAATGESTGDRQPAAIAARRATTPRGLARALRGDLDAIVGKAMARDEGARYASVEELASDLERYLSHHPVRARRPTAGYVGGRFVRRHRVALGVTALVLAAVIGSLAITLRQMQLTLEAQARAARRFDEVRALARTFMFEVHDAIVNVPGTTQARALMVRTTVAYLDRLAAEAADDRSLQRELAAAYVKVGDAQGHPTSANIGDTAGARASYERAIAIAGALTASPDAEAETTLAMAHRRLADVLSWTGDLDGAIAHMRTSHRVFAALASRGAPTRDQRFNAAVAEIKLGDVLGNPNFPNAGKTPDAQRHYDEALGRLRTLAAEPGADDRTRRYVGLVLERIGTMHEVTGALDAAQAAYAESFDLRRALAAAGPLNDEYQRDLAIAYEKLGNAKRSRNDVAGAVGDYRGALEQFERLARVDASNAIAARSVAISREKLAEVLMQTRQDAEALAMLRAARLAHQALAARDPANAQARCDVARVAEVIGDWLAPAPPACGAWADALAQYEWLATRSASPCGTAASVARLRGRTAGCR